MKKAVLVSLFSLGIFSFVHAQRHINLYAGYSFVNPRNWNRTIDAFNFSRPWLANKIPPISKAFTWGFGTSGVIGKGVFLSPEFSYSRYNASSLNTPVSMDIDLKWFRGNMYVDLYPREFKLDSVTFTLRPFVRVGVGASSILPRVSINNVLVGVDDETYKPIIWSYQLSVGLGCRLALSKRIDLTPLILLHYTPNIHLEDFSYALHGTQVPNLNNNQRFSNLMTLMSVSYRLVNNSTN
jgi:hypothetical protein